MTKMYFKGGKGIKNPVDFNGNEIKVGDILTADSFSGDDSFYATYYPNLTKEEVESRKNKPTYIVQYNAEKEFFFANGIEHELYLHDFRFKYTKIVK